MVKQNGMVNLCFCQGVVKGQVYSPSPEVAKLNVIVRCSRKNPKTKKKDIHVHNFIAYGFDASQVVSLCHDGSVVFIAYHVDTKIRIDRKTGVAKVIEENIIDSINLHPDDSVGRIPYLNRCFFQGIFLGLMKQPNAEGIYVLDAYFDSENGDRVHLKFFVYGDELAQRILMNHTKGERMLIEYQIEKSKRILKNGSTEYFTNRVVDRIG